MFIVLGKQRSLCGPGSGGTQIENNFNYGMVAATMTSRQTGSTMSMDLSTSRSERLGRLISRLELMLLFGIGLSLTAAWYVAMAWAGYRVVLWVYEVM